MHVPPTEDPAGCGHAHKPLRGGPPLCMPGVVVLPALPPNLASVSLAPQAARRLGARGPRRASPSNRGSCDVTVASSKHACQGRGAACPFQPLRVKAPLLTTAVRTPSSALRYFSVPWSPTTTSRASPPLRPGPWRSAGPRPRACGACCPGLGGTMLESIRVTGESGRAGGAAEDDTRAGVPPPMTRGRGRL
jgi:hypothetical protein